MVINTLKIQEAGALSFSSTLINKGTVLRVELDNQMLTKTGFSCKRTGIYTFTIN